MHAIGTASCPSDPPHWSALSLGRYARRLLGRRPLIVASQRQPIVHSHVGDGVRRLTPAGGLVSAVLPMVQACGGTWVAESAGDADDAVVDGDGCVHVSAAGPGWTARLLRLPPSLRRAHNDGFSNGGLWPACHDAPGVARFSHGDWLAYQQVPHPHPGAAAGRSRLSQRQGDARSKLRTHGTHGRHRKYGTHGTRPIDVLFATRWLARWGAHKPLFLFDFDGTLAPLQPQRDAVVLADALRIDLRRLAQRWPVAVVSGRGLADLRARLGRGAWRS